MARTDAHSPKNLVTEDYEYAFAYDAHPEAGEGPFRVTMLKGLIAEGYKFTRVHGGDTCDHCGARLRYIAVLKHLPTKGLIKVGETCLENRFERATSEFHALRTTARLNAEQRRKAERIADLVAAHPLLAWLTYNTVEALDGYNEFIESIGYKMLRDGALSDRQIESVEKAIVRATEFADKKAARKAAEEAAKASGEMEPVPATDARIQITGEVLSTKTVETQFGVQFKMLVRDDRGFKVYGTEPTSIQALKGSRVTFMAKVERSRDDEFFGFFSRPTKAAILLTEEATAA